MGVAFRARCVPVLAVFERVGRDPVPYEVASLHQTDGNRGRRRRGANPSHPVTEMARCPTSQGALPTEGVIVRIPRYGRLMRVRHGTAVNRSNQPARKIASKNLAAPSYAQIRQRVLLSAQRTDTRNRPSINCVITVCSPFVLCSVRAGHLA